MLFNFLNRKKETTEKELKSSLVTDSYTFHTLVLPNTLNKIKDILEKSYGPLGSNTLIHNNSDLPIVTKDGYTILKNIKFYDPIESDIHKLILKISNNLVKTVGDGSTSAVLNAITLYNNIVQYLYNFDNRKDLIEILNKIQELITNRIEKNYTYQVNKDNRERVITAVGTVANNNDTQIGKKIADLFSKIPSISNIKIVEDPSDKPVDISYNILHGFSFSGSLSSVGYLQTKNNITLNNCKIFTSYEFFEAHYKKLLELNTDNTPIIVIAEIIDENTKNIALIDYLQKKSNIILIRTFDLQHEMNHNEFIDLSIYLDSNITNIEEYNSEMFGSCAKVECFANKTIFIGGYGKETNTEIFAKRLADTTDEYYNTPENSIAKKGNLKLRIDKMNGVNITLLVSGRTEEERKTAIYLVDDSINAIKSTLNKGFTLGGNIISYYASNDIYNFVEETSDDQILSLFKKNLTNVILTDDTETSTDILLDIFNSVVQSYFEMATHGLLNSSIFDCKDIQNIFTNIESYDCKNPEVFNRITNNFESIENTSILAPVQTDIEILKASFSIVTLLLSINQTIVG